MPVLLKTKLTNYFFMKNLIFFISMLLFSIGFGQQVYLETGLNVTDFNFKNNEGVELENLQSKTQNYLRGGFKHEIFTEGLNLNVGMSYNQYGAIGSDDSVNNFFEWDLDYLGATLGLDYTLFNLGSVSFFIAAQGSAEFLIDGVQTLNNQVINVKEVEEFNDVAYFIRSGGGLRFAISDTATMYLQYMYATGMALNDNNNSQVTELRINVDSIGIGIVMNLPSAKKEEIPSDTEAPSETIEQ